MGDRFFVVHGSVEVGRWLLSEKLERIGSTSRVDPWGV